MTKSASITLTPEQAWYLMLAVSRIPGDAALAFEIFESHQEMVDLFEPFRRTWQGFPTIWKDGLLEAITEDEIAADERLAKR